MKNEFVKSQSNKISSVLGLYKAEWLNGKLFELFTEPQYIGELKTSRPCVLLGGRGTGKTTVLRGLSYQGQFALCNSDTQKIADWKYVGLYHRINTNRVTAFRGPELSQERWTAYFAHYINLTFCLLMLEFANWYEQKVGRAVQIPPAALKNVWATLGLDLDRPFGDLSQEIRLLLSSFEAAINSVSDDQEVQLSMQGAPIDALAEALTCSQELRGKQFFFLIDEFENLEDYQQRVLNTLIKHATASYTFKIGVKELGWRQRATLNPNEQLTSPADYARIDIAEMLGGAKFSAFAEAVVSARLKDGMDEEVAKAFRVQNWLPRLTDLEEAALLLDKKENEQIRKMLDKELTPTEALRAKELHPGELFFLKYWTLGENVGSFASAVREWLSGDKEWRTRFQNHFYASLFSIKKGKRGIRKYYSGWDVYLSLANGNIRYFLELVHAAYLEAGESQGEVLAPISPEMQTKAAQSVGRKNLAELEGLSVDGARLTKLLLGLGRIFQLLADDPRGHTPEVNQFHCIPAANSANEIDPKVTRLLGHAVMHLALVRAPGSKPTDEADTKEYDYMVHPIFAPFFVFSHRRKRKISLESDQILRLIDSPRDAIREILEKNHRSPDVELPDQLKLFDAYYA